MLAAAARDVPRSLRRAAGRAGRGLHDEPLDGHDAAFALADAGVEIAAIVDVGTAGGPATDAARARGSTSAAAGRSPGPTASHASPPCTRGAGGRARRSTPTCCSSPADGTRSCSSGARSAAASATTSRRACFVPDGTGPPGCRSSGPPPATASRPRAVLVRPGRRLRASTSSTCSATRPWPTSLDAVGRAACASVEHVKRATYIGTAHRPGPDVAASLTAAIVNQRSGAGPGRAGPDERPAAVHAGLVRRARRARPRRPVRPGPRDADPRVARRARRRVRERRPVEAPLVLPARRRGSMEAAVLRECAAVRTGVGMMDASTLGKIEVDRPRRGGVPRPDVHERDVDARGRVDPLRVDVRRWTAWRSTTASRCGSPRTGSSSRPRPAARPRCSTTSRSGCRPSGRTSACIARASPSSGRRSR